MLDCHIISFHPCETAAHATLDILSCTGWLVVTVSSLGSVPSSIGNPFLYARASARGTSLSRRWTGTAAGGDAIHPRVRPSDSLDHFHRAAEAGNPRVRTYSAFKSQIFGRTSGTHIGVRERACAGSKRLVRSRGGEPCRAISRTFCAVAAPVRRRHGAVMGVQYLRFDVAMGCGGRGQG